MLKFNIYYPHTEGGKFNIDYYRERHLKMVQSKLGTDICVRTEAEDGLEGLVPDTPPQFSGIGSLYLKLDTVEEFRKLYTPHRQSIAEDIPNFTNITPVAQFSRVKE